MKRIFALTALASLALVACQSNADTIKIGLIGPLTGDAATIGADVLNGAKLAVDQINATGGINGKKVELIAEDGRCTGADAASAAQKLVNVDKVIAIIGGLCSGETLAAAPIAEAAHVVMLSPTSSSPDVTKAGDFIFRNYPSDALKTVAMAKYFKDKGWAKVATVTTNADFSIGFLNALKKDVGEKAMAFSETVDPDTKDFRSVLTRLKGVNFDVFVPNTHTPGSMSILIKQFREQGFTQPMVTHDVGDDKTVWQEAGAASDGLQIINVASIPETSAFGSQFLATYKVQAGLVWAAYSYDSARVLFQVIGAGATDGPAIRDALYKVSSFPGIVGTFGFDQNGDVTGVGYVLKEVQQGASKEVSKIML